MNDADFWTLLRERRSIRRYQDRPVPRRLVQALLEAARWAPSTHNRQPWRFLIVEPGPQREALARRMAQRMIADLVDDGWSPSEAEARGRRSVRRLTTAPVLLLLVLNREELDHYEDERRERAGYLLGVQSVAVAAQNILLAAHHYGLGACWVCAPLFAQDIIRETLSLPPTWDPQAFITVGYPAEHPLPRERRPLEEMVMTVPTPSEHLPESETVSGLEAEAPLVAALAGGVGGAKGALGLYRILPPNTLTVIVNTGDDFEHIGLPISPDLDTVMYTLAGIYHREQGWGLAGDTFHSLEMLGRYGAPTWFRLGDKDMATHIVRRYLKDQGWPLSRITDHLRRSLGVHARILPMSDDPVRTLVVTPEGTLPFQEYFVHRRQAPPVKSLRFQGIEDARPAPGVLSALQNARAIVIAPSNPYLSVDPVLALPGVRDVLRERRQRVVAVTPIIGGEAVKGPLAKLMREFGHEPSALVVARYYQDILGNFVLDERDAHLAEAIRALGIRVAMTDTLMRTDEDKERVARVALNLVEEGLAS